MLKSRTGGPRISWFHNSWSPLFRDSLLGLNFVNSSQFRDFEKKKKKMSENSEKIFFFLNFFFVTTWIFPFPPLFSKAFLLIYLYWNIGIKIQIQIVYRLSEFINANSESLNANSENLIYAGRLNVNSEYFRQHNQKLYLA